MTLEAIREAVHGGDYAKAAERFAEYSGAAPLDETSLREMAELLKWVRTTVLCADAHALARLQSLRDEAHALTVYSR
jgi:hypothetical protein